jgi:glycine oxidase
LPGFTTIMTDLVIIGGGVIGLSLAYEVARHGQRVTLLEQGSFGREASWAGAGILPPARAFHGASAEHALLALSTELHPQWHQRLLSDTGIDNGYRRCGGWYLAANPEPWQGLQQLADFWRWTGLNASLHTAAQLPSIEPALAAAAQSGQLLGGLLVAEEAQIRNPWHVQALVAACQQQGVDLRSDCELTSFEIDGARVTAALTPQSRFTAPQFCITAGAWSGIVAQLLARPLPVRPMRGQIVLFHAAQAPLERIVNLGPRYLVPRQDGRVLVGSTEEEVGFDRSTTESGIAGLCDLAYSLCPALRDATIERTWAGLRPSTPDGQPCLGRLHCWDNVLLAAGHFRSGLTLSCATAVLMAQLVRGEQPQIDLAPFRPDRFTTSD